MKICGVAADTNLTRLCCKQTNHVPLWCSCHPPHTTLAQTLTPPTHLPQHFTLLVTTWTWSVFTQHTQRLCLQGCVASPPLL
jgi:hypothetical protein